MSFKIVRSSLEGSVINVSLLVSETSGLAVDYVVHQRKLNQIEFAKEIALAEAKPALVDKSTDKSDDKSDEPDAIPFNGTATVGDK